MSNQLRLELPAPAVGMPVNAIGVNIADESGADRQPSSWTTESSSMQRQVPAVRPPRDAVALYGATLGDAIAAIRARDDLTPTRRRDLVSGLTTLARLLRRPPEHLPAEPSVLRPMLGKVHPVAVGMSAKRFANVRADALAGLRLATALGLCDTRGPLLPSWQRLSEHCPKPEHKWRLSRLMRWCSAQAIEPTMVDESTLRRFREAVLSSSLRKRPDMPVALAARTWNDLVARVPEWPQVRFVLPRKKGSWTLPWEQFTPAFRDDVDAWIDRLAGRDLLAEDGPPRPLRPVTLQGRRWHVRMAASALVHAGIEVENIKGLSDLVTAPELQENSALAA